MSEAKQQSALIMWAREQVATGAHPELALLHASLNGAHLGGADVKKYISAAINELKYAKISSALSHLYSALREIKGGGGKQWGQLLAQGAVKGIPDLCLPVKRGKYGSLWIEMKTETGTVSKDQKNIGKLLVDSGQYWVVCRSTEQAKTVILEYLEL